MCAPHLYLFLIGFVILALAIGIQFIKPRKERIVPPEMKGSPKSLENDAQGVKQSPYSNAVQREKDLLSGPVPKSALVVIVDKKVQLNGSEM